MQRIGLLIEDLMFTSRLAGPLSQKGMETERVLSPDALTGEIDLLVVDLGGVPESRWAPVVARAAESGIPVAGFAPHRMKELFELAPSRGFALVVPNGRMAADPVAVLAPLLKGQRNHAPDGPKDQG